MRVIYEAPVPAKPVLHLLVVGINEYEDPAFNLRYARPDAEAITRFFEERGSRLFSSVRTIKLLDQEAAKANVQQAFHQLEKRAQPEDALLVYLAGHGVGLGQQFYFLPHETRKGGMRRPPFANMVSLPRYSVRPYPTLRSSSRF